MPNRCPSRRHRPPGIARTLVTTITTEIAVTQWELDQKKPLAQTGEKSPTSPSRVGDQAVENALLIGLVDAHAPRTRTTRKA